MTTNPRVLMVGAGAVAQVYGAALKRGGLEVWACVRTPSKVPSQMPMTRLHLSGSLEVEQFAFDGVVSTPAEVRVRPFDFVWLALPSDALKSKWLVSLVDAWGLATVVSMLPGLGDAEALAAMGVGTDRLVRGLTNLIAFQEPLVEGQQGVAYWPPPMFATPFDGPAELTRTIVEQLKRGGLPAMASAAAIKRSPFMSAALMAHVATLARVDWSLDTFLTPAVLRSSTTAAAQAMELASLTNGPVPSGLGPLTWPALITVGVRVAQALAPLPMEPYLRSHFTKVGSQTSYLLKGLAEEGNARGVPHAAVQALADAPKSAHDVR